MFSHVWLFVTPWTVACQASLSMRFPRQEYWSGLPFPSPGYLPNPGSLAFPALAGWFFTTDPPAKPRVALWFQKRKSYLFKLVWIGFCLWHVLSHLVPVTTLHSAIMIPILRWANWSPERLSNLSKSHSCGVAGFGSKQSNPGVWNLNKSTALQWEINAENVNMNCMLKFN